jgi:hypothetical protein
MPLRDHFHSPLIDRKSWDGVHGQWPAMIVQALANSLPRRYSAAPDIHLGSSIEDDVATFDEGESVDEYEVRVVDNHQGRRLVAAIEIVSPSNKDRLEHRRNFVAKCAGLLHDRVSVTIIDPVTTRSANLYDDLLDFIGEGDTSLDRVRNPLCAATCRWTRRDTTWDLKTWAYPLALGMKLPTLPLWLADNLAIPLELEASYEETCRVLRIS